MKVENKFVIDNIPVEFVTEFSDIKVFEHGSGDEGEEAKVIYFVKGDAVVQTLSIDTGMGQGSGYLSECEFRSVK